VAAAPEAGTITLRVAWLYDTGSGESGSNEYEGGGVFFLGLVCIVFGRSSGGGVYESLLLSLSLSSSGSWCSSRAVPQLRYVMYAMNISIKMNMYSPGSKPRPCDAYSK
jgi:hypothetical protein